MNAKTASEIYRLKTRLAMIDTNLDVLLAKAEVRKLTKLEMQRKLELDGKRKSVFASLVRLQVLAKQGKL